MLIKYFLTKAGVQTQRLVSAPGTGHHDLAKLILTDLEGRPPAPDADVYTQMTQHGYVRVVEDGDKNTIWVDAPRQLKNAQKAFLRRRSDAGWKVEVNNKEFVESRQKPTAAAVQVLVG